MGSVTYRAMKMYIEKKLYGNDKSVAMDRLDVFMTFGRITIEEYTELMNLLDSQE